jgi:hypothetical protein
MAITATESTVTSACMADLEAQRAARPRWAAAKGRVTRAREDGGAEKIAAAAERERAAYREFDRISGEAAAGMLALSRAGPGNLGSPQ